MNKTLQKIYNKKFAVYTFVLVTKITTSQKLVSLYYYISYKKQC